MRKKAYLDLTTASKKNNWWTRGRNSVFDFAIKKYLSEKKPHFLEVGCGCGQNLKFFSKYGKAFGIDHSKRAINICKSGGLNVKFGTATNLPFNSEKFNVVLLADVLEHINNEKKALAESIRVLKPGGLLLVSVPAYQWLFSYHDADLGHKRRYSKKKLLSFFNQKEVLFCSYFFSFALFPLAISRIINSFKRKKTADDLKTNSFFNQIFIFLSKAELFFMRFIPLPFGTSLFLVARKPKESEKYE